MAPEIIAEDDCCPAGDITVTPVPSGFMVGRAMPRIGLGPWWQYIRVMSNYDEAVSFARQVAAEDRAQAWLYRDGKYIALGGSDQQPPPQSSDQNSRPN
jgi:hypothetical protein